MSGPEFLSGPRRAHSLVGKIEGDTKEDLAHNLEHLAFLIRTDQLQGPSLSGSSSGNHIVDYYRDEKMTHERYFAEINAWLEERRRQDAETCCPDNKHTMEGKCRAL